MSSLRNAVSRRPHKERSQPTSREKWGILEKHKDYSLRAADYNTKKKKLAQLSQKVKERNPDEFAFGMITQGKAGLGKHTSKSEQGKPLSHDAVKLLKTQDAGYLRTVAAKGRKEIQRLSEQVGMDGVTMGKRVGGGGKKVFVDDEETVVRGKKRMADGELLKEQKHTQETDTDQEMEEITTTTVPPSKDQAELDLAATKPKTKKQLAAEEDTLARLRAERKKRKRLQEMRVAKLEILKKRQQEILAAADQLELQRAKMARTVGGVNKNGVKFKIRERKK